MKLTGRDFLCTADYTREEIHHLLDVAKRLKAEQKARVSHPILAGKSLAMIFSKSSTRTRVSFEVGVRQLGGQPLFLSSHDIQLGRGEPIRDMARVLSRFVDGIMIRTFSHEDVEELARYSDVPVINGLTDLLHPCQVMADLLTIQEQKGKLSGLKLAYIGDGNNMAHSLLLGCAQVGMEVAVAAPEGYKPLPEIVAKAAGFAKESGGRVEVVSDPKEAAQRADVLYTDVWTSMGQESEQARRLKAFVGYQINAELMALAQSNAIVLHCLPAHRGEEITDDVLEGPQSFVFDQAENRLHAQKAIMAELMAN